MSEAFHIYNFSSWITFCKFDIPIVNHKLQFIIPRTFKVHNLLEILMTQQKQHKDDNVEIKKSHIKRIKNLGRYNLQKRLNNYIMFGNQSCQIHGINGMNIQLNKNSITIGVLCQVHLIAKLTNTRSLILYNETNKTNFKHITRRSMCKN